MPEIKNNNKKAPVYTTSVILLKGMRPAGEILCYNLTPNQPTGSGRPQFYIYKFPSSQGHETLQPFLTKSFLKHTQKNWT